MSENPAENGGMVFHNDAGSHHHIQGSTVHGDVQFGDRHQGVSGPELRDMLESLRELITTAQHNGELPADRASAARTIVGTAIEATDSEDPTATQSIVDLLTGAAPLLATSSQLLTSVTEIANAVQGVVG